MGCSSSPSLSLLLRGPRCTQVIPVQGRVTSLSLSHDQLHLLSCSRDNTLKVIDLRFSNIRQVFRYLPHGLGLWLWLGQLGLLSPMKGSPGPVNGGPPGPGPAEVPHPLTATSILTQLSVLRADGFKCGSDWTKAVFRCVCESTCLCPSVPTRLCLCVSVRGSSPLTSSLLLCRGHCSPDRSFALAGSWDGALYIWDVDTGKLESSLRGPHW